MSSKEHIRKCHVVKEPDEAFEFFLKNGKHGQVISSVTASGPADRAGLKNNDRIITVNGVNVESEGHDEVVKLIKESAPKDEITFEVISEEHDDKVAPPKVNGDVTTDPSLLRPRLCKIKRKKTLGFLLEVQGPEKPGHFIKEVVEGGPAVESGLREGDRIIEVEGVNVEKMNHAKVVNQIKKHSKKVTLLVVDDATYRHYLARKMTIKAKHAYKGSDSISGRSMSSSLNKVSGKSSIASVSQYSEDPKARLLHVVKKSDGGYGFILRVKKDDKGEYFGEVESGKSGQVCGVMENDRVVAVNGDLIFNKEHDDVVEMIKKNPNHAVFLVVGPKAVENAKKYGLLSVFDDITKHLLEKPRIVEMSKSKEGYGFFLKQEKENPNHIITDVEADSAADKAGLKNDETLIGVGNVSVLRLSHHDSVKLIKDAGDRVRLTVGNAETARLLYKLGIEVTTEVLENWPSESMFLIPGMGSYDSFFMDDTPIQKEEKEDVKPRLCVLTKIDDGFGFFLRDEGNHLLGNIEPNGAAAVAGVLENDQIIEVNGVNVEKQTHDDVVERIRSSGDTVTFLVVNEEEKNYFDSRSILITSALLAAASSHDSDESPPRPRFCELTKKDDTFGFHLNGENKERPGQYIRRVIENGAAEIAGLKDGDRVIEVNGINISDKVHEDVVKIIVDSGSQVNFLVVDEDTDLYYRNKKLQITKALIATSIIAATVKNENSDVHSNASSVIEAEATVHAELESEQDKTVPPIMVFPPPPEYDDKEESVAELIVDAIEEAREEEKREELVEELKEEIADEVREELKEEILENAKEEMLEEAREELREAVIDEVKQEVRDEMVEDLKEEIVDDIKEEIKDSIAEEVREDIRDAALTVAAIHAVEEIREGIEEEAKDDVAEEVREDVKDAVVAAAAIHVAEEIREDIKEDIKDSIAEDIREDIKDAAVAVVAAEVVEEIKEDIQDAIEETAKEEAHEKLVDAIKEEIQESKEEEMERLKEEMRKQIEKEMREKMEEEMRQKIASELPPPPPHFIAEPAKAVATAVVANAVVNKVAQSSYNEQQKTENLTHVVNSLKSVKRYNDVKQVNEEKSEENFKPNFRSARAMFEGGQNSQSNVRPSWKKNTTTSSTKVNQPKPQPAQNAPIINGQDKEPAARETSWSGSGMSFKIVETSSVFN